MSRNLGSSAQRAQRGQDDKTMINRRCSVQEFSFAAHVDGVQNREFIEQVAAPVVVSGVRGGAAVLTSRSWCTGSSTT
jgi:cleavage and polyadenylation specificity factor subunit 3